MMSLLLEQCVIFTNELSPCVPIMKLTFLNTYSIHYLVIAA